MSQAVECRYHGRDFTTDEMALLRALIAGPPPLSRVQLSREFSRRIAWYKPDGGLKEMAARVAMLRMHRDGRIVLPAPQRPRHPPRAAHFTPATEAPLLRPPHHLEALRPLHLVAVTGADRQASRRWNEFIARYHYLGYKTLVGPQMRYGVHDRDGTPLALLGFSTAAWKTAPRDRFIGWSHPQREHNLPLLVDNSRFLILPWVRVPNLASHILFLIRQRLAQDWQRRYNIAPVLIETFVDRSRFTGACYRAANWQALGRTKGFSRNPGMPVTWTAHGRPKEIFVYPLVPDAREQLRALDDAAHWRSEGEPVPLTTNRMGSLFECLNTVAEFRGRRGRRYPLATVLAIATAAKLAGYHGVTAFAEFAQALSQEQLRALRAYYSHRLGRFTAPTVTTFHNILTALDPDVLDRAVRTWAAQRSAGQEPVAIDGKSVRGAARQNPDGQNLLVAAAEHCCGLILGQEAVPDKSNEIPAVRTLTSGLALAGRVVTVDALHTQDHTARHLVENCQANYVMTAVKSNRLALLADLAGLDWERPQVRATEHRTEDKRHGRLEKRSCRVIDLSPDAHAGKAKLPHRRVAFRIERERRHRKTGVVQHETVHGLSSLPFEHASAERILALVRGHWSIENRVHYVRDVSYDEDRCRVHTGHLPRNLACLTNVAISIVRLKGRFDYLPQAHRHYARCPEQAVRHLLEPATP